MKVFILGPVASGKSTLAESLEEELNIPKYSIDRIVHNDEMQCKRSEQEQLNIINQVFRKEKEWIIEGMPRTHLDVIANNATIIIYLDYEKAILRKRLKKRNQDIKSGKIQVPYELTEELLEKMNHYIENDNREDKIYLMKRHPQKLIIIKNDKELEKLRIAIREGEILKYQ